MSAVSTEISNTETREKPIIFSGEMVRGILDDRKWQTRRVAKRTSGGHLKEPNGHRRWHPDDPDAVLACPYGQPGDRLWVRETFADVPEHNRVYYRADDPTEYESDGPWSPSIYMPRSASRITLEITDIRVERVQNIILYDVMAEGLPEPCRSEGHPNDKFSWFRSLWDSINAKRGYGWDVNPLVWVIEFERHRP